MDSVRIVNAQGVDGGTVAGKIATTETQRFLGLFPGFIYDYEVFDASALQRDLARVERYYRGQGYFEAHVRAGRIIHTAQDHVRVEIVVDEGTPTLNRNIAITGLDGLPQDIRADGVRAAATSARSRSAAASTRPVTRRALNATVTSLPSPTADTPTPRPRSDATADTSPATGSTTPSR